MRLLRGMCPVHIEGPGVVVQQRNTRSHSSKDTAKEQGHVRWRPPTRMHQQKEIHLNVYAERLVRYLQLLVVPLMGRMSDPLPAVRRLAAPTFATVVSLVPLAQVCLLPLWCGSTSH